MSNKKMEDVPSDFFQAMDWINCELTENHGWIGAGVSFTIFVTKWALIAFIFRGVFNV